MSNIYRTYSAQGAGSTQKTPTDNTGDITREVIQEADEIKKEYYRGIDETITVPDVHQMPQAPSPPDASPDTDTSDPSNP
jgi:hypothetical protein